MRMLVKPPMAVSQQPVGQWVFPHSPLKLDIGVLDPPGVPAPFDHLSFLRSLPECPLQSHTDPCCLHSSFSELHPSRLALLHATLNNGIRLLVRRTEITPHPSASPTRTKLYLQVICGKAIYSNEQTTNVINQRNKQKGSTVLI